MDTFVDSGQDFAGFLHFLAMDGDGPMGAIGHFCHLPIRVCSPVNPNNGSDARRPFGSLGARYTLLAFFGCPLSAATLGGFFMRAHRRPISAASNAKTPAACWGVSNRAGVVGMLHGMVHPLPIVGVRHGSTGRPPRAERGARFQPTGSELSHPAAARKAGAVDGPTVQSAPMASSAAGQRPRDREVPCNCSPQSFRGDAVTQKLTGSYMADRSFRGFEMF